LITALAATTKHLAWLVDSGPERLTVEAMLL
jgi:hypothetical protein